MNLVPLESYPYFLLSNQMILEKMKKRSNDIVDGLGASRVASNLLEMF